jgi:CRISPR-associated exonuclease Cas4
VYKRQVYCPLKRVFRQKFPELSFAFEPNMVLGEMVHVGIQEALKEKGFEIEKEIEEKIVIEGTEYIFKGRIDAFSNDMIIEIKTARSSTGLPHPHHLLQLRIYMAMTGVRRGLLVYITSDRIVEYPVENSNIDLGEMVQKHVEAREFPLWEWECRLCNYNRFCPYRIDK